MPAPPRPERNRARHLHHADRPRHVAVLAALIAAASCHAAAAQTSVDDAARSWSANLGLASQYVSRGFRQTWGEPALQGGLDYAHASGWSAGTWMSSVSNRFIKNGTVEWDWYGGYRGETGGLVYAGQLYYYWYPHAQYAGTRYNYGEAVASLGYGWLTVKYWLTYTPLYFGFNSATSGIGQGLNSRGSGYLEINGDVDLGNGYGLLLHYGRQRVRNFSAYNFSDGKIAVTKVLDGGWSLSAGYTRAWPRTGVYDNYSVGAPDAGGKAEVSDPARGTVAVVVTKVF